MIPSLTRTRVTLLGDLPPLRPGVDTERNVFWVITSIISLVLMCSIGVDFIVNRDVIAQDPVVFGFTIGPLILALGWSLVPVIMKTRFPYWLGAVGYFAVIAVAILNIGLGQDSILVVTAFQILPVAAVYLSWFWRPLPARLMFGISLVLLSVAIVLSPLIGPSGIIPSTIAMFSLLVVVLSFLVGSFLRWHLHRKATTDQLTGVLNGRGLRRQLRIEIERARKHGETLTLAYIDFDNFKQINDRHGHAYGDEVLRKNAAVWIEHIRSYNLIGRLGGDEFAIVFPQTTAQRADVIMHRLLAASRHQWTWGLSELQHVDTPQSLIERADAVLYERKDAGERRTAKALAEQQLHSGSDQRHNDRKCNPDHLQFRGFWSRQTDFSIVSASVALLVLFSTVSAMVLPHFKAEGPLPFLMLSLFSLVCLFGIILPIVLGYRYPQRASLITGFVMMIVYGGLSVITTTVESGIALVFSLALVAIYVGTFSGSVMGRIILALGLIAVSAPLMVRAFHTPDTNGHNIVIVVAAYALLLCFLLYDLGSYLYGRSRKLAHHDALTMALNRHGLVEYGMHEVLRATRQHYPLSVVVIDCIGFKRINDTEGHSAGDELLKRFAKHLLGRVESYDLVVRTGGDEFILILPYRSVSAVDSFIEELQDDAPIAFRFGTSQLQANDTLDSVIERADARLCGREDQAPSTSSDSVVSAND